MREKSAFFAVSLVALLALSAPKQPKAPSDAALQAKLFQKKLNKDEQVLHALDRLTFGPRPGDVEHVKKIGLKKWLDQQLNPERIPENPDLEAKLEPLQSLRMSTLEVVQHYPPPQTILAIAQGRQPMPDDPILRASIERIVARYRIRKGDQAAKNVPAPDPDTDMEPVRTLAEILDPGELQTLRNGTQDSRRALIDTLPPAKLEEVLIAMPRPLRQQLFGIAPVSAQR